MNDTVYREEAKDIPVIADVDVLVVGGGPAGVSAAVGAARAGARTFLVERHGFLGGMWTAGMVLTLAGFNSWLRPYHRCVGGVAGEWIRKAAALNGCQDHTGFVLNSDPEIMKRVADDLVTEAGVDLLFHCWGADPILENGAVKGLCIENVEGRQAIRSRVTVDCTGDGDVMARAGARWTKGQSLQPMTMSFRMGNLQIETDKDIHKPVSPPIGPEPGYLREPTLSQYASVRQDVVVDADHMQAERESGRLPRYGGPWFGGLDADVIWVNSTRITGDASVASELTRAELAGRRETAEIVDYFVRHLPGFAAGRLIQTSTQIGIRETRRLEGVYTLKAEDILGRTDFDDGIALGCWPIDVHPTTDAIGHHAMYVPLPYRIPYRSLLPTNVNGLLVAGRCFSADREALGSARVGATCAAMGHAAGVAAAIAAAASAEPRALDASRIQQDLRAQDAIIDYPG
ncbi:MULTISPECIES: FAD-dependent oxidoreductase [unclassified Chelatococcus]|uniref:FAD-dependent oxidoreductase n=1 Tax=unclassified Chelatococcus TaxID=2638111 RepID=UPI001BD054BC|nr:FAD-dependent oxidoreductase [Chelatococcus sp.]MBS7742536.1 FAD-dependent oxidoreductase [Chelatococcus sp. HY11]CAH1655910.1 FAD dependent oxidoreductase [Hyphomicrobiales bacterium]MBX3542346.1 FAD-dependent oxidoreductase [Chelatococcus sp.]MCO5075436.1 FAD-dependent oxidoreductase [Chelatococcus sp.]CAH1695677.1 FAD dependent oxidoreductase [Hyphomicrobiales bacterium]